MVIKRCFQLLNSLLKFGYYQSMLFFSFSKQITRAIIILYSVVMVNFPSFRNWFIMCLFPDKDMFKNIALFRGSRMFRFIDDYVAPAMLEPTTLPVGTTLPSASQITTRSAQFGCGFLGLPTIRARNRFFVSPFPLQGEFMFSVLYAVLTAIFFSIHTLHYIILLNNMQTLAFIYSNEGTRFENIQPYHGD